MQSQKIYILADNQDITRAGLRHLIDSNFGSSALAVEVHTEQILISELQKHPEAVVVIDYSLFDIQSISALVNLRARYPRSSWIVFVSEMTQDAIRQLCIQGSFSVILKENSAEEIMAALRVVSATDRFICHQISNMLLEERQQSRTVSNLTPSETEILKLIARGLTVKEIASERNSSVHTIISHKKNIFRKIDVNNVYEATKYALQAGLVDLMEYYI